jgi:hypothetical protein
MWNSKLNWRSSCSALGLVGLLVWSGGATTVAASATYGWCSEECDSESDCAMECENDGGGITTCGEYHDGAAEGWCDGDTCDNTCTPSSFPGTECWLGGSLSDCGTYGVFAYCGDDICQTISNGETCVSCSQDCPICPPPPPPCGDSICQPGQTYMTCPQDCEDPEDEGSCGDGICSEGDNEVETCFRDCAMPNDRCEDDFDCSPGYICEMHSGTNAGQCLSIELMGYLDGCGNTGDCENFHGVGFICTEVYNPLTLEEQRVCVWWYDQN